MGRKVRCARSGGGEDSRSVFDPVGSGSRLTPSSRLAHLRAHRGGRGARHDVRVPLVRRRGEEGNRQQPAVRELPHRLLFPCVDEQVEKDGGGVIDGEGPRRLRMAWVAVCGTAFGDFEYSHYNECVGKMWVGERVD